MNEVELNFPVKIDLEELAHSLDHDQGESLIMTIDTAMCEVGFTESVIKQLALSLKPCYDTEEEYLAFLESLK